jgi:hypothetical protein
MKQYMMSVHTVDGEPEPPEDVVQQMYKDVDVFNQKVMAAGQWIFGDGLHPVSTATVVRVDNGEVVTTDGPFIEAKEHLGGFWILKASDLDAALKLAAEASVACRAPVEVRPFQEELPD